APVAAAQPEPPPAPPASPAASAVSAPAGDADASALVDQVTTMVDRALGTGAPSSDTVPVDRAMLEQMKKQLEQIKQSMKKPGTGPGGWRLGAGKTCVLPVPRPQSPASRARA